jgi:hypothetical protein
MKMLRLSLMAAVAVGMTTFGSSDAWALVAVLKGVNQVGTAGDPDGFGTAVAEIVSPTKICFSVIVSKIDKPTEFHIHQGVKGTNGDVAVPFVPPPGGNPGFNAGCTSGLSPLLVNRIRRNPTAYYVNVHTAAFPEGAVRGQLFDPTRQLAP